MSRLILALCLLAGVGPALAGDGPAVAGTAATAASAQKPSSHHCLKSTGTLFLAKTDACSPVNGHSYTHDELMRTGETNTAAALRDLDPSITLVR